MGTGRHSRRSSTRLGVLFRRASRWQQAAAVVCALIAVHGVYVLFVPGVRLPDPALTCPPAVVAAVAGSAGLATPEGVAAAAHDAACAATGRWWLLAATAQTAVAGVWAYTVLEWARVRRRVRRHQRRRRRRQQRRERRAQSASA